ncbi:TPA: hypothetical protein ACOBTX_002721 [Enterococcus faecium]
MRSRGLRVTSTGVDAEAGSGVEESFANTFPAPRSAVEANRVAPNKLIDFITHVPFLGYFVN